MRGSTVRDDSCPARLALNAWIDIVNNNSMCSPPTSADKSWATGVLDASAKPKLESPDPDHAWYEKDSFVLRITPGMKAEMRRAICTMLWITDFKWVSFDSVEDGGDGGVCTEVHYGYRTDTATGKATLYKRDVSKMMKIDTIGRFVWAVPVRGSRGKEVQVRRRRVRYIEIPFDPSLFVGVHGI